MFEVLRERTFSAAHQLRGYQGNCERLHGHNWRVKIHVQARELDELGMVIDFRELDRLMAEALAPFDHQVLNEVAPFDEINPSAENLARAVGDRIARALEPLGKVVIACDVWENDCSRARYRP
jgi:6-pyruvoyltetrahydropterin/6-carboxytetrahydropterin synthase